MDRAAAISLESVKALLGASPSAAFLWDATERRVVWVNQTGERILGRGRVDVIYPDGWQHRDVAGEGRVVGVHAGGTDCEAVGVALAFDAGPENTAELSMHAPSTGTGHVLAPTLIQFDTHPAIVAEEVTRTASYVETLSRHTAAGLLVLTCDGVILHATARALEQLGAARARVIGSGITDFAAIAAGGAFGWSAAVAAMDPIATVELELFEDDHCL